ncbi:hypothetical protein KX816_18960 [Sphingosinicellaceae bacterium]|nr:hypothetical protein KX816_18960 [Sphingosinicellaceae bacterium]
MATKANLVGSFGSLLDTLQHRLDPLATDSVFQAWMSALTTAAGLARATARWNQLPDEDGRYDETVLSLDAATSALVQATLAEAGDIAGALGLVRRTLAMLQAILF